jgi:TonB family protein
LPAVRLAEPDSTTPLSPQALVPELPALVPPPPLPPMPTPPRPRQQALQRPGAFPPPIDLNFGPAASRAPAPRGGGSSRAIDFSLGAPKPGPNKSEAFFDIRAANIGADWAQGLAAYWRLHRYYPQQAAQNGEDGTVEIAIVVNRLGRVESVEIQRRSGSPWLDMAAVGTWRNAQLAPLPAENTDRTITIPLTINYVLIR